MSHQVQSPTSLPILFILEIIISPKIYILGYTKFNQMFLLLIYLSLVTGVDPRLFTKLLHLDWSHAVFLNPGFLFVWFSSKSFYVCYLVMVPFEHSPECAPHPPVLSSIHGSPCRMDFTLRNGISN
jgi:hypothetical protein